MGRVTGELTRERLPSLLEEAGRIAGDADAANALLSGLAQAAEEDYAALDLDGLKDVMQIAALLGQVGAPHLIGELFVRCLNTMQTIGVEAGEYILPLFNLRAAYLMVGADEEASNLLSTIVDAARNAEAVSTPTLRALLELLPAFESSGYTEAAAALYRPVFLSLQSNPEVEWAARIEAAARFGRLLLADNNPADAVSVYQDVLSALDGDAEVTKENADGLRMSLLTLTALAQVKADNADAAQQAYEAAVALAESGPAPDSREAGILYHNLAGFWLGNSSVDRYPQAVELTERSLQISREQGDAHTADHAGGLGQMAILKAGLGNVDGAREYFQACFETFSLAEDTQPADVADYREDEARCLLDAGLIRDAYESLVIARNIRAGIEGLSANKLADTEAWVGITQFELGEFEAAIDSFQSALTRLLSGENLPTLEATRD